MTTTINIPIAEAEIARLKAKLTEAKKVGVDFDTKWTALQARLASLTIQERKEQDRLFVASKEQDEVIAGLERKLAKWERRRDNLVLEEEARKVRLAGLADEYRAVRAVTAEELALEAKGREKFNSSQRSVRIIIAFMVASAIAASFILLGTSGLFMSLNAWDFSVIAMSVGVFVCSVDALVRSVRLALSQYSVGSRHESHLRFIGEHIAPACVSLLIILVVSTFSYSGDADQLYLTIKQVLMCMVGVSVAIVTNFSVRELLIHFIRKARAKKSNITKN